MTYGSVVFTSGTFDGSDFSEAVLSMSYRDTSYSASFENSSLIGANFSKAKLINGFLTLPYEAKVWRTSSVNFSGADLTGANFSDTTLAITTNNYQGKTVNFSGATLKSVNFTNAILGSDGFGLNLAGTDLSSCNFTNAALNRVCLSDSVITNVNFSNARNLTADQLSETKNYKNKNLSGIKFNGLDLTDWNLSGQNLQNTSFNAANLTGVNASYADLRGADLTDITGSLKTQNTIWTDGSIKNFSMLSKNDNLTIRAYVPATSGVEMINSKIVEDATISGGAVLTLEEGAVLEISAGKTLTVSDNGEIVFDVDAAADDTNIILNSGSKLVFGDNSKLTINLTGEVSETDPLHFTVIKATDDSYVLGLDTLPKDNIILNVNGTAYDSSKWGINFDPTTGTLDINVNVPEPATCAVALGALAIAFALMRRRR